MQAANLYVEQGGEGPDLLLMLHGMGATGAVWSPMCEMANARWAGRWIAVDLPGHGGSGRQDSYAIGQSAATVARAVLPHLDPAGRLVVLGHSLGGVIGLALATGWFGAMPHQVFAAGIKISWNDDELRRMETLASQPAKKFSTEEEAWERYLKVSGLAAIADASAAAAARGVERDADGWRLAMDPKANAVGKPPLTELMTLARCPVHLGRGGNDALVTLEQTRALDPDARDLGPHGHNVMIEAPAQVWDWMAAATKAPLGGTPSENSLQG
ncbi:MULTISPECIES: alpha/beta fold hydrolase [Variovorax]|uniref:alpha/beta fold hydrolase n=1 Tax=Variovorax TaxID=34072 RepID=UPI00286387C0|nr:alpha/beta hydrolase [Variovorax sp. 3319]MDR6888328.1 pimeloyl-ACP methyl ester carboxylesterase [Variovorax sp. 3319]